MAEITIIEPPQWGVEVLGELVGLTFSTVDPKAGQMLRGVNGLRRSSIRDFEEYYFVSIEDLEEQCVGQQWLHITGYRDTLLNHVMVLIPKSCCS